MPKLISVGQLIDHSWEHYKTRFGELMSISVWVLVPTLISVVSLAMYPSYTTLAADQTLSALEIAGVAVWLINSLLVGPIIGVWMLSALLKLIYQQLDGKRADIKKISQESWKQFWPMVSVNVLVMLVLMAALLFALPGTILLALAPFVGAALSGIGGVLLVAGVLIATILGVRWLIFFAYSPLALALEGHRGKAALRRSHDLVRGRFWSALARMVLPKTVFMLVLFVAEWLILTLAGVLVESVAGLNVNLGVRLNGVIETLILGIGVVLANPIIFAADVFLYRSLQETYDPTPGTTRLERTDV